VPEKRSVQVTSYTSKLAILVTVTVYATVRDCQLFVTGHDLSITIDGSTIVTVGHQITSEPQSRVVCTVLSKFVDAIFSGIISTCTK
jgi:hypothetical protein